MEPDAGVGIGGSVQHRADGFTGCLRCASLLDPIDQLALAVGLAEFQTPAEFACHIPAGTLDIGQRRGAVNLRLTEAEQVEVRTVQDVHHTRRVAWACRAGHGGTPSWAGTLEA